VISNATPADAAATLEHLEVLASETDFLSFGPGESGITLEGQAEFLKRFEDPAAGAMLKAVVDGEIAGTGSLFRGTRSRFRHAADFGLGVQKRFWGFGVGRALTEALIAAAREQGILRIALRVRADNARAIHLYESLGFVHEGRLVGAFVVGNQAYDDLARALHLT